jgi:hypothetical protein
MNVIAFTTPAAPEPAAPNISSLRRELADAIANRIAATEQAAKAIEEAIREGSQPPSAFPLAPGDGAELTAAIARHNALEIAAHRLGEEASKAAGEAATAPPRSVRSSRIFWTRKAAPSPPRSSPRCRRM